MNTITREFTTAVDAAIVEAKVRRLAGRAARKGIATDLKATTEVTTSENPVTGETDTTYTVTVSFSDLVRFSGGWVLTAVADATGTDEPLVFTLDDDTQAPTDIDMSRCDHCGRRARRKKVLFVRNDAGDEKQVGGSCAQDFLGHDPWWTTILFESLDEEINDSDRVSANIEFPTAVVIAAAIEANRLGYRKSGCEYGTPTKTVMAAMLDGRFWNDKDWKADRWALAEAPAATVTVDQVLDYMRSQDGIFGANLRRVADSTNIGVKAFGLAAYAPAGAAGWREKMAEEMARRAAEAEAKAQAQPVPTTNDRVVITGTVTRTYVRDTEFGYQHKMIVVDDRGFKVCGTVPSNIAPEAEDRVTFTARVTRSDNDPAFGFFSRPTKAQVLD